MAKKNKKEKRQRKGKEVIDLTSYISPEMLQADVDGSYTGVPRETYYEDIPAEPVQDADDHVSPKKRIAKPCNALFSLYLFLLELVKKAFFRRILGGRVALIKGTQQFLLLVRQTGGNIYNDLYIFVAFAHTVQPLNTFTLQLKHGARLCTGRHIVLYIAVQGGHL